MTFIKFCGMTREDDLAVACDLGVDAVGFVLWPSSPRATTVTDLQRLVRRLPPEVIPVGVFVSPSADEISHARDAGIRVAQIHGRGRVKPGGRDFSPAETVEVRAAGERDFSPAEIGIDLWLARPVDADLDAIPESITLLLDANDPVRHGGTGQTVDWRRAAKIARRRRILLAGGLTPANAEDAIRHVRPFGVDVASGIEVEPGVKDAQAMRDFVAAVREAER